MPHKIIYRPNSIPNEAWKSFSQEEQVRWWKDNTLSHDNPQPFDIKRVLDKAHLITLNELAGIIFWNLTAENAAFTIKALPDDALARLREMTSAYPADSDDIGWNELIHLNRVCTSPWATEHEINKRIEGERLKCRNATRLFRAFDSKFTSPPPR